MSREYLENHRVRGSNDSPVFDSGDYKPDNSLLSSVMAKSKKGMNEGMEAIQNSFKPADPIPRPRPIDSEGGSRQHGVNSGSYDPNWQAPSNPAISGSGFTLKDNGMYNSHTGLRGNMAYRNHNPFNITGMSGKLLYGAVGRAVSPGFGNQDAGDMNQLVYANARAGTVAGNTLMSSKRYNNAPIAQAFAKWQSNQKAWGNMKDTYRKNGLDIDNMTYNQLSPQQKYSFMKTRAAHEGFTGQLPNIFL